MTTRTRFQLSCLLTPLQQPNPSTHPAVEPTRIDLLAQHDGLNPAHVPYWWVNNPTLGEFCFTMIGRANIEGSKSNDTMNAWLPQASYPCGNFSDTSSLKLLKTKGSIGHAFTVCIHWAHLSTPALSFDRCAAPAKLPTWQCLWHGSTCQRGLKSRKWAVWPTSALLNK